VRGGGCAPVWCSAGVKWAAEVAVGDELVSLAMLEGAAPASALEGEWGSGMACVQAGWESDRQRRGFGGGWHGPAVWGQPDEL
jgi:hypothetical protein